MKFNNEIKTGLVIVMAIIVGIFYWVKTSNFKSDVYTLKTSFSHAEGVNDSSTVNFAGIEVGRVSELNFVYGDDGTKIELVLLIDNKAKVRSDSIAFIGTTGFIGSSYVGITPCNASDFLKPNDHIISEDPIEMREVMKKAEAIAKNLDSILGDVKTLVSDNKGKVDGIVTNLEQTSTNFNEFSEDIKKHPWKLLIKGKDK